MLVDWEMSKEVHEGDGPRKARQPERTVGPHLLGASHGLTSCFQGTWQYLSIALLRAGLPRVTIPDELESFFHVLLYYALRYVKSANASGLAIANFLEAYYDVYGFEDGAYVCGAQKRLTIEMGRIQVSSGTDLHFDNPLDDLFANLLSWFKARYIVLAYDGQESDSTANQQPPASAADLSQPPAATRRNYAQDTFAAQLAAPAPPSASARLQAPTAERELAKRLDTHDQMLQLFLKAMGEVWPPQLAADQIPPTWKPSDKYRHPSSEAVEKKRARLDAEAMSEPPMPLVQSRPPITPPRRAATSMGPFPDTSSR